MEKTENDLIFIEHEVPVSINELDEKLKMLRNACDADDDHGVREAMRVVVPTVKNPKDVNREAMGKAA